MYQGFKLWYDFGDIKILEFKIKKNQSLKGIGLIFQSKTPFAEHILGMRIRGSKDAFHLYPLINIFCKSGKFFHVHMFADIFSLASIQP